MNLPSKNINIREVVSGSLGYSTNDVKNWFRVTPSFVGARLDFITYADSKFAVINLDSQIRHGWRKFEATTEFFVPYRIRATTSLKVRSPFLQVMGEITEILAKQHHKNDELLNGAVTLASVRPDLRVGNAVVLKDERAGTNNVFYTETVEHTGQAGGRTQTTLHLTRGQDLKEASSEQVDLDTVRIGNRGSLRFIKLNASNKIRVDKGTELVGTSEAAGIDITN